jgi:hypothetical protein
MKSLISKDLHFLLCNRCLSVIAGTPRNAATSSTRMYCGSVYVRPKAFS